MEEEQLKQVFELGFQCGWDNCNTPTAYPPLWIAWLNNVRQLTGKDLKEYEINALVAWDTADLETRQKFTQSPIQHTHTTET